MARIPIDKKIGIEKLVDLNSKSTFSKILSQIGWMDPKQKEKIRYVCSKPVQKEKSILIAGTRYLST